MGKYIVMLLVVVYGLSSCSDRKPVWSQSEVNAKIDSITGERLAELNERSMEDLNNRMSIEVKVKVDSILAAKAKRNPVSPAAAPGTMPDTAVIQP